MTRTAKIVLIVVGSIMVIGIGLGVVAWRFIANNFTTEPVAVAAIGQEITPHELPEGYEGEFGTDLFGFKVMMAVDGFGTESMIMLMSVPDGGSDSELRAASREQLSSQRGTNVDFEFVGTRDISVRGVEVGLDRYEGNDGNLTFVQEIAIFEASDGKSGLVMLFSDLDLYEEAGFEQFLKSLE